MRYFEMPGFSTFVVLSHNIFRQSRNTGATSNGYFNREASLTVLLGNE